MKNWTESDFNSLVQAAQEVDARPMDLLLVLYSESGLDPFSSAKNTEGEIVARGLNQITEANYKAMGMSKSEWESISSMTPSENLYYVVRSLKSAVGNMSFPDAGTLYEVNFAPARLKEFGSGDDVVLYSSPHKYYEANKGLDTDKKGYINVRDMRNILKRKSLEPAFLFYSDKLRQLYPNTEDFVIGFDEEYKKSEIPIGGILALAAVATGIFFYFKKA